MRVTNFKMVMTYWSEETSLGQHCGPAAGVTVSNFFTSVVALKPQPGVKVSTQFTLADGLQISVYILITCKIPFQHVLLV